MDKPAKLDHHVSLAQLSDGSAFYLLKLVVAQKTYYSSSAPETLCRLPQPDLGGATSRPITVSMSTDDRGMQWLINGKTHTMEEDRHQQPAAPLAAPAFLMPLFTQLRG